MSWARGTWLKDYRLFCRDKREKQQKMGEFSNFCCFLIVLRLTLFLALADMDVDTVDLDVFIGANHQIFDTADDPGLDEI